MKQIQLMALGILICFGLNAIAQVPYLEKSGESTKLVVDGNPFVMLAGKLHNSTCSCEE